MNKKPNGYREPKETDIIGLDDIVIVPWKGTDTEAKVVNALLEDRYQVAGKFDGEAKILMIHKDLVTLKKHHITDQEIEDEKFPVAGNDSDTVDLDEDDDFIPDDEEDEDDFIPDEEEDDFIPDEEEEEKSDGTTNEFNELGGGVDIE